MVRTWYDYGTKEIQSVPFTGKKIKYYYTNIPCYPARSPYLAGGVKNIGEKSAHVTGFSYLCKKIQIG